MVISEFTQELRSYFVFLLLFFAAFASCASANAAPQRGESSQQVSATNSGLEESIDTIRRAYTGRNGVSFDSVSDAVVKITSYLRAAELEKNETVRLRYWRGVALAFLIQRQSFDGEEIILNVETALADFDYVLSTEAGAKKDNAARIAGVIAYNYLKDETKAGAYWSLCAESGHAGCINNVASGYFTGALGFPLDIEKSIENHKRVFDTGTAFGCAGFFSGLQLAEIAAFLPMYETGSSFATWLDKSFSMIGGRGCSRGNASLVAYLIHLRNGESRTDYLETAQTLAPLAIVSRIADYYLGAGIESDVRDEISAIPISSSKCIVAHNMFLHGFMTDNVDIRNAYSKIIADESAFGCTIAKGWIYHLTENSAASTETP